jgi:hypothetical protein
MTRAIIFAVTILLCAGGVYAQWGQQGLLMTGGGGGPSPSGPTPTLVQAYFGDRSNNGANACSNNICTWPLTHPIAAGHTVVGYVHGANGADNAPMYPQSIKDQNGNSYTITPAAEWTPFHEDIICLVFAESAGDRHLVYNGFCPVQRFLGCGHFCRYGVRRICQCPKPHCSQPICQQQRNTIIDDNADLASSDLGIRLSLY